MRQRRPWQADEVIGAHVRALRETKKASQDDLARRMRFYGFVDWQQGTVSAVERGARRLSVLELAFLAYWGKTEVAWFVETSESIEANAHGQISGRTFSRMWRGRPVAGRELPKPMLARALGLSERERAAASQAARSKAERQAALRLADDLGAAVTADAVALASVRLWGRSLTDERDARVASQGIGLSARSVQALRGHVTRALIDELRPSIARRAGRRKP